MKLVISLGGSLIASPPTDENFSKYASVLKKISEKCDKLVVVVGGGDSARKLIAEAQAKGLSLKKQDLAGIKGTHQNASRLVQKFGIKMKIPTSDSELETLAKEKKFLICGGTKPGQSTDNVAAVAASAIKADLLINASNIDAVYDKDPKKNKDARKFEKMGYDELIEIVKQNEQTPGKYALFDLKAAELCKKNKIKIAFIDGRNPENLHGKNIGTLIS